MRRALLVLALIGCAHEAEQKKTAAPMPTPTQTPTAENLPPAPTEKLFSDLGTYHRGISTKVPSAQRYFDQGLRFAYAFNHDEAQRSFEEAARQDPSCAICYWGAALVLGPNYNQPAAPERAKQALAYLAKAKTAATASPVERALIGTLAHRYADPPPAADDQKAQAALDQAYADAMHALAKEFADDDDVQVLFAESMMDLRPWKLWEPDGKPAPGTDEIVTTLERVLQRNPQHPGANHYYIHATEASPNPERGVDAAGRVAALMPGAGHLVHMPSHVYQRVGRYNDAAEANRRAIVADKKYVAAVGEPKGFYGMYVAHNHQFLWMSALMAGRGAESLQAAREMLTMIPMEMFKAMPDFSFLLAAPVLTLVRFGKWDDVLAEKEPPSELPVPSLLWHYAQARALAAKGKLKEAERELNSMKMARANIGKTAMAAMAPAPTIAEIVFDVAKGDIACRRGQTSECVAKLKAAVAAQDSLPYDEPPDFYYPVRQTLGAWLLKAKKPADAEAVFVEDLKRNPDNGWSLVGLKRALEAQKKPTADVDAKLAAAWKDADTQLASSDF